MSDFKRSGCSISNDGSRFNSSKLYSEIDFLSRNSKILSEPRILQWPRIPIFFHCGKGDPEIEFLPLHSGWLRYRGSKSNCSQRYRADRTCWRLPHTEFHNYPLSHTRFEFDQCPIFSSAMRMKHPSACSFRWNLSLKMTESQPKGSFFFVIPFSFQQVRSVFAYLSGPHASTTHPCNGWSGSTFGHQGFCENTVLHDQDPKDQQCFQVLDVQH